MKKTQEEVLEIISATVARARNLVDNVEWSAMDATRTPIDYLCRCVETAIKAGATTINLPDTVGYATPDEYQAMFRDRARARAAMPTRRSFPSIATMISASPSPIRSPASQAARGRSSAPSTASASAPATRRWRRS